MPEPAKSGSGSAAAPTPAPTNTDPNDFLAKAKYKRVRFEPKSNPIDTNDVVLAVQGFQVKCQRGVETICPDFILEAADHATYKKFTVRPGEGRKVGETIRKFPYSVLGDATPEQFFSELRSGTKKTKQAVAMHGLKIPVEQAIPQEDV